MHGGNGPLTTAACRLPPAACCPTALLPSAAQLYRDCLRLADYISTRVRPRGTLLRLRSVCIVHDSVGARPPAAAADMARHAAAGAGRQPPRAARPGAPGLQEEQGRDRPTADRGAEGGVSGAAALLVQAAGRCMRCLPPRCSRAPLLGAAASTHVLRFTEIQICLQCCAGPEQLHVPRGPAPGQRRGAEGPRQV